MWNAAVLCHGPGHRLYVPGGAGSTGTALRYILPGVQPVLPADRLLSVAQLLPLPVDSWPDCLAEPSLSGRVESGNRIPAVRLLER